MIYNNTDDKIKIHNSGGDYVEREYQIHNWNPSSKNTLPRYFYKFLLLDTHKVEYSYTDYSKHFTKMPKRSMTEKTKPNKHPKKENKYHLENLSANLDEIKAEFK